jgi:hypothetical protein|tara:strand:+ start:473 stop:1318 length:846 start_codon:yes stop_codon:yes gene_type:complete
MKLIFTAVVGRSGQSSLTYIFNKYGIGCFAEFEPPDLIFRRKGKLGSIAQKIQRKWIVSHELLGRGKAKEWLENGNHKKLSMIAKKKIKRIDRLRKKYCFETYIEVSKFFMRTQCDHIYLNVPHLAIIKLTRDPLLNARSFANRRKRFYQDNVPPHYKQNCLQMNEERLSEFQLYLWSWFEIELRYFRFLEQHKVDKVFEIKTEGLNEKEEIIKMFNYFGIAYRDIIDLAPRNTNIQQGYQQTMVTSKDIKEYEDFINMVPAHLLNKVKYLKDYNPYIHSH